MATLKDELRAHLIAAKAYGELSTAQRLKVGALIVREGRPLTNGRNGMPSGGSNVCEENGVTKGEVIHAEKNAIAFASKDGIATKGAILITTDSPCIDCATLIIQAGIKEVYYEREYRDSTPLDFLREYGILVQKVELE